MLCSGRVLLRRCPHRRGRVGGGAASATHEIPFAWENLALKFFALDRLVYWLALGAITLIRLLPLKICFLLGQVIGALAWAILPRYRRLATENLSAVFANELSSSGIRCHGPPSTSRPRPSSSRARSPVPRS